MRTVSGAGPTGIVTGRYAASAPEVEAARATAKGRHRSVLGKLDMEKAEGPAQPDNIRGTGRGSAKIRDASETAREF